MGYCPFKIGASVVSCHKVYKMTNMLLTQDNNCHYKINLLLSKCINVHFLERHFVALFILSQV